MCYCGRVTQPTLPSSERPCDHCSGPERRRALLIVSDDRGPMGYVESAYCWPCYSGAEAA